MRFEMTKVLSIAGIFSALFIGPAFTQAGGPTPPGTDQRLPYFDGPVGFSEFRRLTVYRSWGDAKLFYLLPSGIKETPASNLTFHYERLNGKLKGSISLALQPAFDEDEFSAVVGELKSKVPDGLFSVSEPVSSEWEVLGFGLDKDVTPTLMSNPLLTGTSVRFDVPELLSRILLHEGSHYATAFVVRHKYSIRGIELDAAMQPRVVSRWFSRGVSFPGGCGLTPEKYIDIQNGKTGCIYKLTFSKNDIQQVQFLLRKLHLYLGPIDGILGLSTRMAIQKFQADNNMLQDGEYSSILLDKLREKTS